MKGRHGLTLIELLIVLVVLGILAGAVFPMGKMAIKRARETELKRNLRTVREAIDRYKDYYDQGQFEQKVGSNGYPPTLEILVEGVPLVKSPTPDKKIRFLRKIPKDPMTPEGEWRLIGMDDDPVSSSWGGDDVFDIRSTSDGVALDGSQYAEW